MQENELIPDFLGYDVEGAAVSASDFPGTPLVIYFYPKDNTPGCSAEACSLRDSYATLISMGYKLVGISRDSAASHGRFAVKYNLPFALLTDPEGEVCQAFGVWQKKKMAGREYMGIVRTTFVTDADHRVAAVISKVNTKEAGPQLLDVIASLAKE